MDLLTTQNEYTNQEIKGVVYKNGILRRKEFTSCLFLKCSFSETVFEECHFNACIFRKCDLSLVHFKDCSFSETRFEDSQVIGVDWTETTWASSKFTLAKPVDFLSCVLNFSTFMGMNLKQINLIKCIAREVSFEEANLTSANCSYTDFTNSRFLHTNLTGADFTGAKNYTIAAHLNTLKKTRFSLPDAMSLLYSLDIILSEYKMDSED
jgi:fluoroquinolone resistance protein